eukprot:TRINITY_DN18005_c0_g1_i1.p1 TRINITY_DN18005_c0_g1~~TRINITY_DN18005_c0_g1_i1.p1  ORF type:complete len:202 (-),score=29.54 TRINITY_DN18005_c0_g1_i1:156-761(-)
MNKNLALISLLVGYFGYILSQTTFPFIMPTLVESNIITLSESSNILSYGNIASFSGNLILGKCIDSYPINFFSILLILISLALFLFSQSATYLSFAISWSVLKFFASGGWIGMIALALKIYHESEMQNIFSKFAAGSRASALTSGILIGISLKFLAWRTIFLISSAVIGIVGITTLQLIKTNEKKNDNKKNVDKKNDNKKK